MIQNAKLTARAIVLDEEKLAALDPAKIVSMTPYKLDLKCEADGAFLGELAALLKKHGQEAA